MGGTLTAKQEKLLVLFKSAMEDERKAQQAYRETLRLCDDPSLRGIIESIIQQEKAHEEALLRMYNDLRKTGEFKDAT